MAKLSQGRPGSNDGTGDGSTALWRCKSRDGESGEGKSGSRTQGKRAEARTPGASSVINRNVGGAGGRRGEVRAGRGARAIPPARGVAVASLAASANSAGRSAPGWTGKRHIARCRRARAP